MPVYGRDDLTEAALREKVRASLRRCRDADTDCEDCQEWTGESCGMAAEALRLLDIDEAAILEFARMYEQAKMDNIGHTSFQPGLARMRARREIYAKLARLGVEA